MDKKAFLEKSLDIQIEYHKSLSQVTEIVDKINPMLATIVEGLSDKFDKIQDLTLDALEVPETAEDEKYRKENFERTVIKHLMFHAVSSPEKYKDAVVTMTLDWENLRNYSNGLESHTWFYAKEVLDEFIKPSIKEKKTTKKSVDK